jgi:outer membrane protein TolC
MKTSLLHITTVCFLQTITMTALAQPTAKALSWADCVSILQKNNPELVTSEQTVKANEAAEGVARAGFFPQISGSLGYTQQSKSSIGLSANPNTVIRNSQQYYSASLNASENLFNGYADWAKLQQSQWSTVASRNDYQISKAQVSNDLINAFEDLRYALDAQKLSQSIISRREENLRLVELRFESGLENKGSVLLSQANLEQAKFEYLQAQNAESNARSQLAKVLNFDSETIITLTDTIPTQEPSQTPPDFNKITLKTPDVQKVIAQEKSAQAGIDLGKSGFFPSLNLTGSTGKTDSVFFPEQQNAWSVGATLTIPIWNGNKDISAYHQAVATSIASENQTITTTAATTVKLRQSYATYIESVAKLKVDTQYQVAAKTRADIGRNKYNNGLLTFEDWDTIENDLINREKSLIQSRRDRVLNEAAWVQAQGQGVVP